MALVPTVQASDITVKVNGEEIHPEMAPVIVEERTLVPLRAVSEALGCDVSWDADTKGITLCDGSNLYFTWIDKDHAFKTSATALEDTTVMGCAADYNERLYNGTAKSNIGNVRRNG